MESDWKAALRRNRVELINNLENPEEVADHLYADGIINEEMKAGICAKPLRNDRTREILDKLNYRGWRSVPALYNAFKNTSNMELAELLLEHVQKIELTEKLTDPKEWPPNEKELEEMLKDKVVKIKHTQSSFLHEYNEQDVYKMQKKVRGKVLMINNEFKGSNDSRQGSEKDVDMLTHIFQQLHFEVELGNNLKAKEMTAFFEKKRKEIVWEEVECLIIVLMSHGVESHILGADSEDVKISDLLDIFSSKNCPGLDDKPRLVFIQACRNLTGKKAKDEKGAPSKQENAKDETDAEPSTISNPLPKNLELKHPSADFLVAYSTPEGKESYRHTITGSWFVNAVAWTLKYHAHHEELQHLLIRVNRIVAKGQTAPQFAPKFTVSEVKSNLRKKFFFFPGVYGESPHLFE